MATVAAMAPAIACSLIAFLSAQECVHELCSRLGKLVHVSEVTPHAMLTMLFEPLVTLMGIELSEVHCAARLLATRVLANDLVAYHDLTRQSSSGALSVRTRRLLAYPLCSFANVGSTAVTMGGLSAIAPSRSRDVASLIFRALVAGCIANLLTACTVGTMITNKANPVVAKFSALDFLDG
ncbi:solute carrier family 28 member 3-like [Amblyomma americanum]